MFTNAIGTLEYELAHLRVIQKRLATEGTDATRQQVADNIQEIEDAIEVLSEFQP